MPLDLNSLFVFIHNAPSRHQGKETCSTLLAYACILFFLAIFMSCFCCDLRLWMLVSKVHVVFFISYDDVYQHKDIYWHVEYFTQNLFLS
jgi:hypothetical protein